MLPGNFRTDSGGAPYGIPRLPKPAKIKTATDTTTPPPLEEEVFVSIDLESPKSDIDANSTEQPLKEVASQQSPKRLAQLVGALRFLIYNFGPVIIPFAVAYGNALQDFKATLRANGKDFTPQDQERYNKLYHFWAFTDYATTSLMVVSAYVYRFAKEGFLAKFYPELRKPNNPEDPWRVNFAKNIKREVVYWISRIPTIFVSATGMNAGLQARLKSQLNEPFTSASWKNKLGWVWLKAAIEELPFFLLSSKISPWLSQKVDSLVDKYCQGDWTETFKLKDFLRIVEGIALSVPLFMGLGTISGVIEYIRRSDEGVAPATAKEYFKFYTEEMIPIFAVLGLCYGALMSPLKVIDVWLMKKMDESSQRTA